MTRMKVTSTLAGNIKVKRVRKRNEQTVYPAVESAANIDALAAAVTLALLSEEERAALPK